MTSVPDCNDDCNDCDDNYNQKKIYISLKYEPNSVQQIKSSKVCSRCQFIATAAIFEQYFRFLDEITPNYLILNANVHARLPVCACASGRESVFSPCEEM